MSYTPDQIEAIVQLKSFMFNEVTEPAMKLIKKLFEQSCPFVYNIEFAINHGEFLIISSPDNHTMTPFKEELLWSFNESCKGDVLAFPVNCFEDVPILVPIREAPGGFGHANLIIINRSLRTIEHFDPHGTKMNDLTLKQQKKFEKAVKALFQRGPWINYKYLPPRTVCPTDGVQNLLIDYGSEEQIKSTCRIWCYHFLSERLVNPSISAADINKATLEKLTKGRKVGLGKRVENFIIEFILKLYTLIEVKFVEMDNQICLRWPNQSVKKKYCVPKRKLSQRRRFSNRRTTKTKQ